MERVVRQQEAREVVASHAVTREAQPVEPAARPVEATAQAVVGAEAAISAEATVTTAAAVVTKAAEAYAANPVEASDASKVINREPVVPAAGEAEVRKAVVATTPIQSGEASTVQVPHKPAPAPVAAQPVPVTTALPPRAGPTTKVDFGWLIEAIRARVENRKGYPHLARMNRWEGTVTIVVRLKPAGQEALLADARIEESSGYAVLDSHALEVIRQAFPLPLKYPLEKAQSFSYSLAFKMAQ